jgi:hypothetical protein
MFLVKAQPFQGGEFGFLGLGFKAVNVPQAFDDMAAFLGKALPQVDEVYPCWQPRIGETGRNG